MSCQSKRSNRGHSFGTPQTKAFIWFLEENRLMRNLIKKFIIGRVGGHRRGNKQKIRLSVLNPGVIGIKVYGNGSIQDVCVILNDPVYFHDCLIALKKALGKDFTIVLH